MKFNLKNRPFISIFDIISTPISESTFNKIKEYIDINEAWFEGFEKELREKWKKLDCESDLELGQSMIIREILGES